MNMESENNGRRDFLKKTGVALSAGASIGIHTDKLMAQETPNLQTSYNKTMLYYGDAQSALLPKTDPRTGQPVINARTRQPVLDSFLNKVNTDRNCDHIVLQPGHFKTNACRDKGIAYVSISGINQNDPFLKEELVKAGLDFNDPNNFLKDERGRIRMDPNSKGKDGVPEAKLLDIRQKKVKEALHNYITRLVSVGKYEGIMFDAIGEYISVENNMTGTGRLDASGNEIMATNPQERDKGLTEAALQFIDILKNNTNPKFGVLKDKYVIVNNGLTNYEGLSVDETGQKLNPVQKISQLADELLVEGQFAAKDNEESVNWLVSRLGMIENNSTLKKVTFVNNSTPLAKSINEGQTLAKRGVDHARDILFKVKQQSGTDLSGTCCFTDPEFMNASVCNFNCDAASQLNASNRGKQ